jgi:hypothetical protein
MNAVFEALIEYRPAGSSRNSYRPSASVNVPRGTRSSVAVMRTVARRMGCPVSTVRTRPRIVERPAAGRTSLGG